MSLVTQVSTLATRIGTEFKAVRATLGPLASLTTTEKATLVGAINEVKAGQSSAGAQINDTAAGAGTVYSSQKTTALVNAAVAGVVDSSPAALDTLKELAAALGNDANYAATTSAALGNRLRVDAAQALTGPQKTQGLANLGAVSSTDVGPTTTDFVPVFEAALA